MAPPLKRRRLTKSSLSPSLARNDLARAEPSTRRLHSVQHLKHQGSSSTTRKVPQRIDEIHLQIQERPVDTADFRVQRRQGAPQEIQTIQTVDANGNTITATITAGEGAGAATSNSTPATTPSTTDTDTGTSGSSPSGSSNSTSPATSPSTSPTTDLSSSQNSTDTSDATRTDSENTTDRTAQTQLPANEFRTTLNNGDTKTLTRSDEPYETSFGQQTLTVCPSGSTCRISTETKTSTEDESTPTDTSNEQTTATSSLVVYPAGAGGQSAAASPSPSSSTDAGQHASNDDSTPPAGTIAGGVVGGAAGIAILLLIALIFLRWYKRRDQQRHHALPANSTMSPDPDYPPPSSRHPGMAERAGLRPLVGAVPGFFRHQNPSSEETASSERGFTKVSGRKLPSQFSQGMSSGGMSSPPPTMPLTSTGSSEERNLSSHSFYRDRDGFYGGEGDASNSYQMSESPPRGHTGGREYGEMVLSPGPQRTPTIHAGGPYSITPGTSAPSTPVHPAHRPLSPPGTTSTAGGQQTMMRSETPSSVTDNRSSRFTEEV